MTRRKAPNWLTQWEYAHRGLHSDGVPENSLLGARLAMEAGYGVECDIQRSVDDQPVMFHDWDLSRLTGENGETGSRTAEQLGTLRLLATGERPARLATLLELVNGRVPLLIEIKSRRGYDVDRTCVAVADLLQHYRGDHAVMSFDPRVARWFRKHSSQTPCGLVMREDEFGYTQKAWQRRLAFRIAKPDFLAYHIHALPSRWVAKLRAKGIPVLTWTVATPELRQRALHDADALITEADGFA